MSLRIGILSEVQVCLLSVHKHLADDSFYSTLRSIGIRVDYIDYSPQIKLSCIKILYNSIQLQNKIRNVLI